MIMDFLEALQGSCARELEIKNENYIIIKVHYKNNFKRMNYVLNILKIIYIVIKNYFVLLTIFKKIVQK